MDGFEEELPGTAGSDTGDASAVFPSELVTA
jgi:hypothetical protein